MASIHVHIFGRTYCPACLRQGKVKTGQRSPHVTTLIPHNHSLLLRIGNCRFEGAAQVASWLLQRLGRSQFFCLMFLDWIRMTESVSRNRGVARVRGEPVFTAKSAKDSRRSRRRKRVRNILVICKARWRAVIRWLFLQRCYAVFSVRREIRLPKAAFHSSPTLIASRLPLLVQALTVAGHAGESILD
jgi:hypothetical protein